MPRLDDSLSVLLKKIIKYMMLLARGRRIKGITPYLPTVAIFRRSIQFACKIYGLNMLIISFKYTAFLH